MTKRTAVGLAGILVMLLAACSTLQAGQAPQIPSTSAAPSPAPPVQRILVLKMAASGTGYSITDSTLVPSSATLSMPPPVADGQSLNYAVSDASGRLLFEASMPNPMVVHSPLSPPGEPQKGHETVVLPQGEYIIRIPHDPSAVTLQVVVGAKPVIAASGAATTGAPPPPPPGAHTFSVQPWLRAAEAKAR